MSVPEKSFEPGAACPLDGVRVIDMSRLVSGNMISLQLADFGAEVLKILVDLPDDEIGRLPMHNVIPRLSETPGRLRRPAPALGEHTAEILGSLGLARAEIDSLAREGIIRVAGDAP
jgi:crotonobetainyl-CoA:carnitine CoA-transferase CaiB-like acyl-CoA transferase